MEMTVGGGFCGVCRQSFENRAIRYCEKCRTPYHPECWNYNDRRCAVYACTPLRGPLRVIRGRGLSRGDSVVLMLGLAAIVLIVLYGCFFF